MPGTNLTRDEAATRGRLLDVDTYDVSLDLTTSETTFASETVIRFSCSDPGASTFADLVDATVREIALNGRQLDPSTYADGRIPLPSLQADNELRVVADCTYSRSGEGLHRFVDPADDRVYCYTQFEVPDARRVFTTFEQPDLKARFSFQVTAPSHWRVVSNSPAPEPQPAADGAAVWRFPRTDRLSTYITAVVAGEYDVVGDTYRGHRGDIALGLYVRQSLREHLDADDIFEVTKAGFAFFEDAFDMAYPFAKYDQLFVPEYNMGAMENAGAVTFRDEYVYRSRQTRAAYEARANTILHEMAHMWFGDLVTMRWWDDLWLNESFAEWAAHHTSAAATRYDQAWTNFCNSRKNWAYRQDQLPSTHPIAADNHDLEAVEVNFDGITYAKGASALRQLVAWVGEKEFFAGLRTYFQRHAYGNTELADLLRALEETSGRDLTAWASEWLQTAGVNTLRSEFEVDDAGVFTSFAIRQSAHPDFPTLRRHRVAIGLYSLSGGRLVRDSHVELDVADEHTDVPKLVGQRQPDLVLLNDDDLTYAKIRLDPRSLATVVDHIDGFADSLPRALVWGACWDMLRDGEMRTTDWVNLVLRGLAVESDLMAVRTLLRNTHSAVWRYSAPGRRREIAARWEQGLLDLAQSATAGSDQQLAFVRGLAESASTDEALSMVAGLLDGSRVLDGLAVDTDLRWLLLSCLAREGRVGEDAVRAEEERDNTISGQEHAAAARAAMPGAAAKQTAWRRALSTDTPNETMRSIVFSFHQPRQDDLLQPYVEAYLNAAETAWEDLGVFQASIVLGHLFPYYLTTTQTRDRVAAWLADPANTANPSAQRFVSEGLDELRRALRGQSCDANGTHP